MGPEGGAPETGKEERSLYLEEETAAHSSVLAWRIPGTEEPGGLPSVELDTTEAAARIHGGPPCARCCKRFMDGQSSQHIRQLAASRSCSFSFLNYDKIYKTKITILNIFKRAIQWH